MRRLFCLGEEGGGDDGGFAGGLEVVDAEDVGALQEGGYVGGDGGGEAGFGDRKVGGLEVAGGFAEEAFAG